MRTPIYLVTILSLLFAGCEDTQVVDLPDGTGYFPLEVGSIIEYKTDSIIFNDSPGGNEQDTFSGYVREVLARKFETTVGDTTYVIERYHKRDFVDPWTLTNVFSQSVESDQALREENNLLIAKMRFPLRATTEWDPTAFIDPSTEVPIGSEFVDMFTNWNGAVLSLGTEITIDSFDFANTLHVQLADDDNEIERRFVHEWYADGIGLIMKVDTILDSRCKRLGDLLPCLDEDSDGNLIPQPWAVKAEKGYILHQKIIGIK